MPNEISSMSSRPRNTSAFNHDILFFLYRQTLLFNCKIFLMRTTVPYTGAYFQMVNLSFFHRVFYLIVEVQRQSVGVGIASLHVLRLPKIWLGRQIFLLHDSVASPDENARHQDLFHESIHTTSYVSASGNG